MCNVKCQECPGFCKLVYIMSSSKYSLLTGWVWQVIMHERPRTGRNTSFIGVARKNVHNPFLDFPTSHNGSPQQYNFNVEGNQHDTGLAFCLTISCGCSDVWLGTSIPFKNFKKQKNLYWSQMELIYQYRFINSRTNLLCYDPPQGSNKQGGRV